MSAVRGGERDSRMAARENWRGGPPHELMREMRSSCPVNWSEGFEDFPGEAGFWSVTTAQDVDTVSRDWRTYSSELGGITAANVVIPLELTRALFIGMDAPKHDRI